MNDDEATTKKLYWLLGDWTSYHHRPTGDVIASAPTHKSERQLAPHPSLKPQQFLRTLVRGVLPLGQGLVLDPFCGTGSALAAAEAVGYSSIGVEKDGGFAKIIQHDVP